jgi:hypothetical protein
LAGSLSGITGLVVKPLAGKRYFLLGIFDGNAKIAESIKN